MAETLTPPAALAVALLLGAAATGAVAAFEEGKTTTEVTVSLAAPSTVESGESVALRVGVTNTGTETVSAVGVKVTGFPEWINVTAIRTNGTVAGEKNAVFWTDPLAPNETVTVTYVLAAEASTDSGRTTLTITAATNNRTVNRTHSLRAEAGTPNTPTPTPTSTPTPHTAEHSPTTTTGGAERTATVDETGAPDDEDETGTEDDVVTLIPGLDLPEAALAVLLAVLVARRRVD